MDINTPLHIATSNNHTKAMIVLLEAGASPNKKSIDKNTALHIAASRGFKTAVSININAISNYVYLTLNY